MVQDASILFLGGGGLEKTNQLFYPFFGGNTELKPQKKWGSCSLRNLFGKKTEGRTVETPPPPNPFCPHLKQPPPFSSRVGLSPMMGAFNGRCCPSPSLAHKDLRNQDQAVRDGMGCWGVGARAAQQGERCGVRSNCEILGEGGKGDEAGNWSGIT